jgi:5-methylcytosine-specific restriction enzyme subunit McrC
MITTDKPSDEDLKQIFTYNLYWNSQRSLLLYPKVTQTDGNFGKYHQGHQDGHYCKIAFIDVLGEDGKLNRYIGKDILQKLER